MRHRRFAKQAVKRFLPGEELADGLAAAQALAKVPIRSVLTELGENVTSDDDARAVTRHYREMLDRIAALKLPAHVSIKLTHLGLDLGEALCREQLMNLAAKARAVGTVVWVDMEGSAYTDQTLDMFRAVRAQYDNVGVCVQAYLYRTADDLDRLAPLHPAIRLVKGAYQEPASIAYPKKGDVDASYLALAKRLLEDQRFLGGAGPGFGTHDVGLIRQLAAHAERIGVAKNDFELLMLYGIRRDDQVALAKEGYTVRVLISYGAAWFPWYMRRLAERPANVWFVVRSMVGG